MADEDRKTFISGGLRDLYRPYSRFAMKMCGLADLAVFEDFIEESGEGAGTASHGDL